MKVKAVEDVVACVVDYGTFISVAEKLAETMRTVYYHSPYETEYQDIRNCCQGSGLDRVLRLDEFLAPDYLDAIDLFVFPDIGFSALQEHLKRLGKAVWGHMGGTELELYRTDFLDILKTVGLPRIEFKTITGVTALAEYLKKHKDKWIKIDRYRANMETWFHHDFIHSAGTLDTLAVIFGGAKETINFIVQDQIEADMEVGYDGWCIDGQFPSHSFQGYEKKNELYLGSVLSNDDLPDEIKEVNERLAPVLKAFVYRDWWATEIRIMDRKAYFIDPTPRMPGQTAEHQLESVANLDEVIWLGANGILVDPKMRWQFAAEATLHYHLKSRDPAGEQSWKTLDIPKGVARWVKLYHYCKIDGVYHFPNADSDEVGIVMGVGNSAAKAIDHLMDNLQALKHLPIDAKIGGFASLLDDIKDAEAQGITFGGKIPSPESVVKRSLDLT